MNWLTDIIRLAGGNVKGFQTYVSMHNAKT
jgi:hypothetical protein